MNADQVRAAVLSWMQYTPADWECNDKKKWGIIEMLNNAVRLGASNKEAKYPPQGCAGVAVPGRCWDASGNWII